MIIIANQFIKIYNSIINISKINFPIQQSYQIYLLENIINFIDDTDGEEDNNGIE